MPNEGTDSDRIAEAPPAAQETRERRPPWALVSRGWLALMLLLLAWVAVYLIWHGVAFIVQL